MDTQPILAAWAASSSDSTKVSKTITGIVVSATSFVVLLAGLSLHIQISAGDVLTFATELGTVGGFVWGLSGFLLKMIHWLAKSKTPSFHLPVDA